MWLRVLLLVVDSASASECPSDEVKSLTRLELSRELRDRVVSRHHNVLSLKDFRIDCAWFLLPTGNLERDAFQPLDAAAETASASAHVNVVCGAVTGVPIYVCLSYLGMLTRRFGLAAEFPAEKTGLNRVPHNDET